MNLQKALEQLLHWYNQNKRDLPWRKDTDPYHIWISEIMLQQTRVEAVMNYYNRFIETIKDVETLAQIEEQTLLKLWEGLGYYSRARNLKQAAIQIVNDYQGTFPSNYQELKKLKGIGDYTAAAIASIAFKEKVPAIDGNILRVMMRLLNSYDDITSPKTKKNLFNLLQPLMPDNPGGLNQAFMDLGATICIPNGKPKCEICPLKQNCQSYHHQTTEELPIKIKKVKKTQEEYTVLLLQYKDQIALEKRKETGLLANLYTFPSIEKIQTEEEIKKYIKGITEIQKGPFAKHVFTHKIWYMQSYIIKVTKKDKKYLWCTKDKIQTYPIPSAHQTFKKEILGGKQ